MRYTVYIFRCLSTGTYFMGVTNDLRSCLEELRSHSGWRRLAHPELLHVEQHDSRLMAQRRLQAIHRQWRHLTTRPGILVPDLLNTTSAALISSSLH
ncbi:MAG: hypothetical protein ACETWG_13355 [Candidatus Neomarinimicrobiota bacterium]